MKYIYAYGLIFLVLPALVIASENSETLEAKKIVLIATPARVIASNSREALEAKKIIPVPIGILSGDNPQPQLIALPYLPVGYVDEENLAYLRQEVQSLLANPTFASPQFLVGQIKSSAEDWEQALETIEMQAPSSAFLARLKGSTNRFSTSMESFETGQDNADTEEKKKDIIIYLRGQLLACRLYTKLLHDKREEILEEIQNTD